MVIILYVSYSYKYCDVFLSEIASHIREKGIEYKIDRQNMNLECEKFKIIGLPINCGRIGGFRNDKIQYAVFKQYPAYRVSNREYEKIDKTTEDIKARLRENVRLISESELYGIIDEIICQCENRNQLKEHRCSCGRLLGRFNGQAEVKCPKCGKINLIEK